MAQRPLGSGLSAHDPALDTVRRSDHAATAPSAQVCRDSAVGRLVPLGRCYMSRVLWSRRSHQSKECWKDYASRSSTAWSILLGALVVVVELRHHESAAVVCSSGSWFDETSL